MRGWGVSAGRPAQPGAPPSCCPDVHRCYRKFPAALLVRGWKGPQMARAGAAQSGCSATPEPIHMQFLGRTRTEEMCLKPRQVENKTYTHFSCFEWDFIFITLPAVSHKHSSGKEGTSPSSCPSRPHRRRNGQTRSAEAGRLPGSVCKAEAASGTHGERCRGPASPTCEEPPHNPSLGPKFTPPAPKEACVTHNPGARGRRGAMHPMEKPR